MLTTRGTEDRAKTEPLLADETVPSVFLPSNDDRPRNKLATRIFGGLFVLILVGAIAAGTNARAPEWHPLLAPYVEFVEQERGLEFARQVTLVNTDVEELILPNVRRVRGSDRRSPQLDQAYRLLGLENLDPAESSVNGPIEDVLFLRTEEAITDSHYRLETEQIFLRRDLPEEALQLNIVHELTRALQHQHGLVPTDFGEIPSFSPLDESDEQRLYDALVEGDATRIERAYYDQLSPEEQQAYHEASGNLLEGVRDPASESDRYTIGAAFTEWIVEVHGTEVLNEMMRLREHGSTDLFVDVLGDFSQSVNAVSEADLPTTEEPVEEGFGAFGWFLALAPHVGTADAFDAIIGYDNDAFIVQANSEVQRTSPLRTCIRSEVFFDSAGDASEFAAIVSQLPFQAEVHEDRQSVRVDLCEQLSLVADQTASPVMALIVANELAAHHVGEGHDVEVARCAAIEQAKTVPADISLDGITGYGAYIDNSGAFIDSCL